LSFGFHLPNTKPVVRADQPMNVTIIVLDDANEGWTVTLLAHGDLVSGRNIIPANAIFWRANPSPPFQNGRLNRDTPQTVARGFGPTTVHGTLHFSLKDQWEYSPGDYTQTLNFQLSSP
ncbi:MAG TPA: hypothetical protein VLB09_03915, partial [Nitrospiria bacterium]|nr:hypothetical protein [Nitrospiria bacterium]